MSLGTKIGEDFLRIPKLDVAGTNWVIYKDRLLWSVDARGLLHHLDGTSTEPQDPIDRTVAMPVLAEDPETAAHPGPSAEGSEKAIPPSVEDSAKHEEWKKSLKVWRQEEAIVKQQIAGTIPDSLFMKIRGSGSARDIWDALSKDFQNKSRMVSVDLRRRLQDERCGEKGDVRAHFSKLRTMREDLSAMGHPPTDSDFYAIILGSLPPSYDPYISAVNATSSVLGTTLSADDLMLTVTEEHERRVLKSKGGKRDENVAFSANDGKGHSKKNVECYNCGKKGHYKRDCWAPGGGKEGQGPASKGKGKAKDGKAKETAAAAKDKEKEEEKKEEAWIAMAEENVTDFKAEGLDVFAGLSDGDDTCNDPQEGAMMGHDDDLTSSDLSDFSDLFEGSDCSSVESVDDIDEYDDVPDLQSVSDSDSELGDDGEDESSVMPGLQICSDSEDEDDMELATAINPEVDETELVVLDDSAYTRTFDYAMLTEDSSEKLVDVELYDSGASRHMSGFRRRFVNFKSIPLKPITAADKRSFNATRMGDMYINVPNGETTSRVLLRDVLYAPTMGVTLVSISRITSAGSTVIFTKDLCKIYGRDRELIGKIEVDGGLYRVYQGRRQASADFAGKAAEVVTIDELHRRMGHVSHDAAKILVEKGLVKGIRLDETSKATVCESCEWAKGVRKEIQRTRVGDRAERVGDEVHSDLWGPAPVETINRKEYYITFTDDHSRFTHLYLLRTKDQTFDAYISYEAWLNTQQGIQIKKLRSDRGGEYLSAEFSDHLAKAGTVRQLTVHDTPEYNGVSERLNRTLLVKIRAMLHDSGLPKFLWGEAAHHAVYLKNRTWTRALANTTPYEIMMGEKPDLSNLHPWGCHVRVHDANGSKLDGRSKIGRWVGFDEESNGHRIYWPEKRSITVERSVKFNVEDVLAEEEQLEGEIDEVEVPMGSEQSPSCSHAPTIEEVPDEDNPTPAPHVPEPTTEPEGRPQRVRKESNYVRRLREGEGVTGIRSFLPKGLQEGSSNDVELNVADEWEMVSVEDFAMASVTESVEGIMPGFEEAKKRPDWPKWQGAIKAELENLKANNTWSLVERPSNANVVQSKWVLRIKKNAAGEIEKYKARLVAKGFTQVYGVDFYETYAPVAKLASFQLILALAARNGWPISSFDFISAYLTTPLRDEVIYIEQPPEYEEKPRAKWVCQLIKTIYGLRQGAKNWYDTLCEAMAKLGFRRAEADHGVFYKEEKGELVIMAVHVDDCIITGSSEQLVEKSKKELNDLHSLTDLGPAHWLLGFKITRNLTERTLALSQHSYIDSILTRFNFNDLKPSSIPIDPNTPLSTTQCPTKLEDIAKMRNVPYREAVGSLMYAAMGTRPDIAFAVSTVSQFSHNPGWVHWEAVKRIFRYLLGTKDLELVYGGEKRGLVGYTDADGASQEHRRAISGYVFLIDGGAVSWSSKKQELVTLSTTEAEYVAATHAAKEAMWLRRLITEIYGPPDDPTTLFGDNQSAIALTKDGHYHARTKHIDIRYHYIRYVVEAGSIKLIYCPTHEMTADVLTKALPSAKAKHFASALGLATV